MMRVRALFQRRVLRHGGVLAALAVLGLLLVGAGPLTGANARAQEATPLLSVAFGPSEIWMPSQDAITALHQCQGDSVSCVDQVMQDNGASADAMAFYHLTGWFLSDIQDTGVVQLGTIFNPWRANENSQPVLLGGVPAVVYPEFAAQDNNFAGEVEQDPNYAALQANNPKIMFWAPGPKFAGLETAPDGGQRFLFDYRLLNGCHACAILGFARFAFDFAPDGTSAGAHYLGIMPPPQEQS